jgi:uncharacterized CHY-type Zn-finger protein
MCKHVLNAQVSIRAPCCKKWFDCAECHNERTDHELKKQPEMVLGCKKCRKVFRITVDDFEETDEYCPGCDNHYYIAAKTPEQRGQVVLGFEGSMDMIQDERAAPHTPSLHRDHRLESGTGAAPSASAVPPPASASSAQMHTTFQLST